MNTNSDDILLLKLIKQGDQIAFRHLFYQYADSLERFITYYIHDREKSQDLVLDIFTYIWENRQNFEIKLTLKAYLFQAARNKSFTYIRDKKIPAGQPYQNHKASIRFRHRPIQTNYIHVFAKTTIILSYPPVYRFKPICYGMIVAVLYYLHLS